MRRPRVAPTDRRIAISLVRPAARASSMLATLAAAISSTSPNAAMTMPAPLRTVCRATGSDRAAAGSTISDRRAARLLLIDAARDHREIRAHLREIRVVAAPADQRQPAHVRVLMRRFCSGRNTTAIDVGAKNAAFAMSTPSNPAGATPTTVTSRPFRTIGF